MTVFSGAGISAESGVPTFRDVETGLWAQVDPYEISSSEGWQAHPDRVWAWYLWRHHMMAAVEPNDAHRAVAAWQDYADVHVVTQNGDDLHERGGALNVLHMHGEHLKAWCTCCDRRHRWTGPLLHRPECPTCGMQALRPDVVWFGEVPYRMDEIYRAVSEADLFVSIGTSGAVYPAAGLVRTARDLGVQTLELNLERSQGSAWFHETRLGAATEIVPAWVEELLAS